MNHGVKKTHRYLVEHEPFHECLKKLQYLQYHIGSSEGNTGKFLDLQITFTYFFLSFVDAQFKSTQLKMSRFHSKKLKKFQKHQSKKRSEENYSVTTSKFLSLFLYIAYSATLSPYFRFDILEPGRIGCLQLPGPKNLRCALSSTYRTYFIFILFRS